MVSRADRSRLNCTKFFYPAAPEDYVPRLRLKERLDQVAHWPLTLVSAPAGYGKTTAVAAWFNGIDLPKAWLSLDAEDNNPALFQVYFLAAIRRGAPHFGLGLEAMLEGGRSPTTDTFIKLFWTELDAFEQEMIVVLDDFHLIHNSEVLVLVRELMRHTHPALHLVLLSRHDPLLPLSEWRGRNQMVEMRSNDLRFSREETAVFAQAALDAALDEESVALLQAKTEGWPAGLRLAMLSLGSAADARDSIRQLHTGSHQILEFLTDQVLSRVPPAMQSFLMQTSILDRMSGPLCEAVLAPDHDDLDGVEMLREIYRRNLFLIPLSEDQEWFRYHHLFRDLLLGRLLQENTPGEVARLHSRASRWFAEAGYLEEALQHAMAAGEMETAVSLVAANRHDLLNQERFLRLDQWCRRFPQAVIDQSPDLLLARAWFDLIVRVDLAEVKRLTSAVDDLIGRQELEPRRAQLLLAENAILQGVPHYYECEPATALAYGQNGLEVLPESYYLARSYGWLYSAVSLQALGDLPGAFEAARRGQLEDLAYADSPRARSLGASGFISWMAADLAGVRQAGEQLLMVAVSDNQRHTLGWGHYFLACDCYQRNDLAGAMEHARKAQEDRLVNFGLFNTYTELILMLVYQAMGDETAVGETMAEARSYAFNMRSAPLVLLVESFQNELAILQNDGRRAASWARQALPSIKPGAMPLFYVPQLTVAKALLAGADSADREYLAQLLRELRACAVAGHNKFVLITVLALEAMFEASRGDEQTALAALADSLSLAEPSGYIRLYVDLGPRMQELLHRFTQADGATANAEYVARILASFEPSRMRQNLTLVEPLTERELQVLDLLARRLSNKEIARELVITPGTAKRHTIHIYQKLNVRGRLEAVEAARELSLLP